jgi:hypothetical protein
MLYGYFDESGHEKQSWVTLAGFIGDYSQWRKFVPKWSAALGQRPFLHLSKL